MKSKLLVLFLVLFTATCRNVSRYETLKRLNIEIDGKKREYIIYIPNGLASNSPLIIALHGYTDNDSAFMNYTELNKVADKNGFAVCYPQGLTDSSGKTFWQVGYSFHRNEDVDDVSFLSTLTKHLQTVYGFNKDRTFVTGMSNGGDMCILLACKRPDLFKAAAPVVGCMMKVVYDSCSSSTPIPVFMINGTEDKITWWDGDLNDKQHYGAYLPVLTTFDFFVMKNKCTNLLSDTIPDSNTRDSSYIITNKYIGGINGNQVWLWTVVKGGHDWIGKEGNFDLNASEEIWNFFKLI
jgi:polyhydroxybutyrate depolymerase